MANLLGLDAAGNQAFVKTTGGGSDGDPYIVNHDLFTSQLESAFVSTASGTAIVIPIAATFKFRVMAMTITSLSGCTVKLQSTDANETSIDKTPPFHIAANGNLTQSNPLGLFESSIGHKINAVVSGATTCTVMLSYRKVL